MSNSQFGNFFWEKDLLIDVLLNFRRDIFGGKSYFIKSCLILLKHSEIYDELLDMFS